MSDVNMWQNRLATIARLEAASKRENEKARKKARGVS